MEPAAKLLVLAGVGLALVGLAVWAAARAGLGRLPGDVFVQRGGFTLAFPIVTSIVLSIVLTVVLNVVIRAMR